MVAGQIELVINCETDGFAHSHYVTHGPGVCAIALDVDNAGRAMERAEALKARTFYQPVGPGELEIPAIHGVGGSLLYFLDKAGKNWDTDFEPVASDAARIALLDGRSHLAIDALRRDAVVAVVLYRHFRPASACRRWRSPIRTGLVQSQAIINADQSLRLVLNGSVAPTNPVGALHLGIFRLRRPAHRVLCDDIFAAVADMRARGAGFLDIPDNYYDDIEAKYDLDAATMAALRANQDSLRPRRRREFFQVYTHIFDERFFFEIVERRQLPGFWRGQRRRSGWRRRSARCGR